MNTSHISSSTTNSGVLNSLHSTKQAQAQVLQYPGLTDPRFYDQCFSMKDLVMINPTVGPVARMKYLLSDQWVENQLYHTSAFYMTIFVTVACMLCTGLCMAKKYQRKELTWRTHLVYWFNFTNAFIFAVLINFGWTGNVFIPAAVHNSIEFLLIVNLCRSGIKKYLLRNSEFGTRILEDISLFLAFATALPTCSLSTSISMPSSRSLVASSTHRSLSSPCSSR